MTRANGVEDREEVRRHAGPEGSAQRPPHTVEAAAGPGDGVQPGFFPTHEQLQTTVEPLGAAALHVVLPGHAAHHGVPEVTDEARERPAVEQDAGIGEDDDLARGTLEPRVEGRRLAGTGRQGMD